MKKIDSMKVKGNKIRRKKFLILFTVIFINVVLIGGLGMYTTARYKSNISINVDSTSGETICDVVVDSNENYIENNLAYFDIYVNNYKKMNDGTVVVTSTDVDYTITIENKEGSNGRYHYVDSDGNSSDTPVSNLVINNGYLGKNKESKRVRVYVTTTGSAKSNVDFKVKLDAKSKNMA